MATQNQVIRADLVIMLDHHLAVYPDYWPMVYIGPKMEAALGQTQCDGIIETRPRANWIVELKEKKNLVDVRTGAVCEGGIYSMKRSTRRP